jgi:uncharacterized protein (TIGR03545 family)
MSDNLTKIQEPWEKPFRRNGIIVVGVLFLIGLVYLKFGLDYTLKSELEKIASELNGAKVDIHSIKTNFLKSEIEITGLQVGNHGDPMRNLLQIDSLVMKVGLDPLLRKKLFIDNLKVEGIHYGTARNQSGILLDDGEQDNRINLLDRVASGMYGEMRNKMNDNPLKQLGTLLTGSNIHDGLYDMKSKLRSTKCIVDMKKKMELHYQSWARRQNGILGVRDLTEIEKVVSSLGNSSNFDDIRPIETKITQKITDLQGITKTIDEEGNKFQKDLNNVDQYLTEDVNDLKERLKLPTLDNRDLSNQVFGPALLNYLERISYWVDLTRRKMAKGNRNDLLTTRTTDHNGTDVHFGKMAAYPAIFLNEGNFLSDLSADPTKGKIIGKLTGLTTDPPIYGKPTEFTVEATFPGVGVEGFKMNFVVDHTQDAYNENLIASMDNFPITNLVLVESGDLKFSIAKATASFKFQSEFLDNALKAHLTASLSDVEYNVVSRFQRIEDTVRQAVTLATQFDIDAKIEGPLDKLQLSIVSPLGERLAWEIQSEFKHQVGAIEDDIRKYMLDMIFPEKEDLSTNFKHLSENALSSTEDLVKKLQELKRIAVQRVARNETSVKPKRRPASTD